MPPTPSTGPRRQISARALFWWQVLLGAGIGVGNVVIVGVLASVSPVGAPVAAWVPAVLVWVGLGIGGLWALERRKPAPLPAPVFERIRELTGIEPVERYGMSETLITISARADGERRPGWVGVPIAGVRSRLRDDRGAEVPHDGESVGNLEIGGDTLFAGSLGLAEATAKSFTADGWFRTGDLAAIAEGGFHRIVGRASVDLIKTGGYRVGAGEVEGALLAHPAVAEVAVVGVPDEDLGQRILAHVVREPGVEVSAEELIQAVAGELSVHKRPREVRFTDSLPRNAMGKVQKTQLLPGGGAPR